jgi:hypothetical protein
LKIFDLDLRPLKEVFETVFNHNDPAKRRSEEEYQPKKQPEKPHSGHYLFVVYIATNSGLLRLLKQHG